MEGKSIKGNDNLDKLIKQNIIRILAWEGENIKIIKAFGRIIFFYCKKKHDNNYKKKIPGETFFKLLGRQINAMEFFQVPQKLSDKPG